MRDFVVIIVWSLRMHDSACGNLYIIKDLWDCFGCFTHSQRHYYTISNAWACPERRRLPQSAAADLRRLDIIFVLEMVLNQRQTISHGHACQRGTQKTVFYFQKIIIYQRADDGFFIFEQINGIFCFIEIQINAGMSA